MLMLRHGSLRAINIVDSYKYKKTKDKIVAWQNCSHRCSLGLNLFAETPKGVEHIVVADAMGTLSSHENLI